MAVTVRTKGVIWSNQLDLLSAAFNGYVGRKGERLAWGFKGFSRKLCGLA